jgi:mannose/fructose/N-acetylgalactosamine-specific phosphotransferase system component IIC
MPVPASTGAISTGDTRVIKVLHYSKAWLTAVGFILTLVTQVSLPHPAPWFIAVQGAATALAVLLVPNAPKEGVPNVSKKP